MPPALGLRGALCRVLPSPWGLRTRIHPVAFMLRQILPLPTVCRDLSGLLPDSSWGGGTGRWLSRLEHKAHPVWRPCGQSSPCATQERHGTRGGSMVDRVVLCYLSLFATLTTPAPGREDKSFVPGSPLGGLADTTQKKKYKFQLGSPTTQTYVTQRAGLWPAHSDPSFRLQNSGPPCLVILLGCPHQPEAWTREERAPCVPVCPRPVLSVCPSVC